MTYIIIQNITAPNNVYSPLLTPILLTPHNTHRTYYSLSPRQILEPNPAPARHNLNALISSLVHCRDATSLLQARGTTSTDAFPWQVQLRHQV